MSISTDFQIRPYHNKDKKEIIDLHIHALKAAGAYTGSGEWDDDLQTIQEHYFQRKGYFLVAAADNKVIAMGALRQVNKMTGEIKRMRVHPSYQRQGIGRKLLLALEEKAKEYGYKKLILDTTIVQTAAQKLYERENYQITKTGALGGFETIINQKNL